MRVADPPEGANMASWKKWTVVLVLALTAGGWLAWKPAWTWYVLRELAAADEASRAAWIDRVVLLDTAAVPPLLDCLAADDVRACANAEAALSSLAQSWGAADPRTLDVARQVVGRFANLSVPGREAVLEWQLVVLKLGKGQTPLVEPARDLLHQAAQNTAPGTQLRALALADVLADRLPAASWLASARELVRNGLTSSTVEARVRAIHLTAHAHFQSDTELRQAVLPFLHDADAHLRCAAVVALAPARDLINEEELLPLLHDPDTAVRRLCTTALRSRGLNDDHILLGGLATDARPAARLEVLPLLEGAELAPGEAGTWLRRLCHDASPAVRAAAVRAGALQSEIDLTDLLRQMAGNDPSPTVRQLAAYYSASSDRSTSARPQRGRPARPD
jgi:hypothetical protein